LTGANGASVDITYNLLSVNNAQINPVNGYSNPQVIQVNDQTVRTYKMQLIDMGKASADPIENFCTKYTWTFPSNWIQQGSYSIDEANQAVSVSVKPDNCTGGNVTVQGFNCGTSSKIATIPVTRTAQYVPAAITGSSTAYCSNTNPIAFQTLSIPNITIYKWNLPSGWTGSSTSNSITVTPNGKNGGTISVQSFACNSYSNPSSKAIGFQLDPSTTISGANPLCRSGTFSVVNQPSGTSTTWTSSVPNNLSINASTGVATQLGNYSGYATITGTISVCNLPTSQTIWVGNPIYNSISIDGNSEPYPLCGFDNIAFTANTDHIIVTNASANTSGQPAPVTYTLNGMAGVVSGSALSSTTYDFRAKSSNTSFNITVSASNSCATIQQCLQFSNGIGPMLATYPNPSSSTMTVSVTDSLSTDNANALQQSPYRLILFDRFGGTAYSVESDQTELQIPVSTLPSGIYYLNVYYKDAMLKRQVVIHH